MAGSAQNGAWNMAQALPAVAAAAWLGLPLLYFRSRKRAAAKPAPLHPAYRHCTRSTADVKAELPKNVPLSALEVRAEDLNLSRAKRIYDEYGCLVVRGLNRAYVERIKSHADEAFADALSMLDAGETQAVASASGQHLGVITPNQTLFIPAPKGHARSHQVMVLGLDYLTSAAMFQAATDERTLELAAKLLDEPVGVELFGKGQCFFKEGVPKAGGAGGLDSTHYSTRGFADDVARTVGRPGGNPKYLHQDSAYFMFGGEGVCATLNYTTRTDLARDNGPLYVIPGSHRHGHLPHVDTPSHLGLNSEWSFEDGVCIEGDAGDAIFFHVHTVHGSPPNRSADSRATFINRYLATDDYQAFMATDVAMRTAARASYEAGMARGVRPEKERGVVVRGRRVWRADSAPCKLNVGVNH